MLNDREKILIVDDETDIAIILKLYLEDSGYRTSWANEGRRAIEMLSTGEYLALLLDVKMPGMNGIEVLEELRRTGRDVAVVMMTAHGNESIAVECMKAGAVDYFVKPFDMPDILRRIKRALFFQRALVAKKKLEQEKDDFVSMLSHDMKNPLTAAIGSIDIIREGRLGNVNSEQKEYLDSAIESCNEVVSMIDNLLGIHRFEAGLIQMHLRAIDPTDTLLAVIRRFKILAEREDIFLESKIESSPPYIAVDSNIFVRIIENLLGNAIKFTPSGGKITLETSSCQTDSIRSLKLPEYMQLPTALTRCRSLFSLSIRDNGPGIPQEEHLLIFNRFVQSDRNSKSKAGSGLGLAFCKMAVECFGGVIWVSECDSGGSDFTFLLPGHDPIDSALNSDE